MVRSKWGQKKWGTFKWGGDTGIYINGVEVTETYDLYIEDLLASEVNTASFGIIGDYTARPVEHSIVSIWVSGTKLFAGIITEVTPNQLNPSEYYYDVTCSDFTRSLDKKLVIEDYEGKTVNYIINDIVTNYCSDITVANVSCATVVTRIKFNYQYVSECIRELAEIVGYDWYVDYDKDIHFFDITTTTEIAPIELIPNSADFYDLKITRDIEQRCNRVFIRGGVYLGNALTKIISADGTQTVYNFDYFPHTVVASVDTGGGYVVATVGVENVDDPTTKDFLMNYKEKTIKEASISHLSAGHLLKLVYQPELPILVTRQDTDSQDEIKAIEGGDGIYDKQIIDEDVLSIAEARELGDGYIALHKDVVFTGTFRTMKWGFKSGQKLTVNLPAYSIDDTFMVTNVTIENLGADQLEFSVTFTNLIQSYNQMMIKLFDRINNKSLTGDEVLNRSDLTSDGVNITETHGEVLRTLATNPFKWGSDADQGTWNMAQWG